MDDLPVIGPTGPTIAIAHDELERLGRLAQQARVDLAVQAGQVASGVRRRRVGRIREWCHGVDFGPTSSCTVAGSCGPGRAVTGLFGRPAAQQALLFGQHLADADARVVDVELAQLV